MEAYITYGGHSYAISLQGTNSVILSSGQYYILTDQELDQKINEAINEYNLKFLAMEDTIYYLELENKDLKEANKINLKELDQKNRLEDLKEIQQEAEKLGLYDAQMIEQVARDAFDYACRAITFKDRVLYAPDFNDYWQQKNKGEG